MYIQNMHFATVSINIISLLSDVAAPSQSFWRSRGLVTLVLFNSTCIHAFQRYINFSPSMQTFFPSLTLSADPVMTSDPSSDMSTAKMAALCPVRVVRRRQREMSHTLACKEIKIRLRMYRWVNTILNPTKIHLNFYLSLHFKFYVYMHGSLELRVSQMIARSHCLKPNVSFASWENQDSLWGSLTWT